MKTTIKSFVVTLTLLTLIFTTTSSATMADIVFSDQPFTGDNQTKTSFTAGDNIYAKVTIPEGCKAQCKGQISNSAKKVVPEIKYYINGEYQSSFVMALKEGAMDATTILLDIAPSPAQMTAYKDPNIVYQKFGPYRGGAEKFTNALSELSGKNKIKIIFWNCYAERAEGEFSISGSDYGKYKTLLEQIKK